MKKLLYILILFIIVCCAPKKTYTEWMNYNMIGKTAIQSYEYDYSRSEFDSMCNADNIPNDILLWISTPFINAADKTSFTRYIYTVKNNIDSLMDDVYIMEIINDTLYHIELRKTIQIR